MSDQTDLSTLQRKAGSGRAQTDGAGMSPAKAFRLAVSKAAQVELGLAVQLQSFKEEHLTQPQLLETLDEDALLLMLEGPEGGMGVAVLDIQTISALIEVQTLGVVIASEAEKRNPTRTDSAMCEAILDRILQAFEGHLANDAAAGWATGYRFAKPIANARLLGLALADVPYRMFHLTLNMADGAKTGLLQIGLPADGPRSSQVAAGGESSWSQTLETVVGASHVEILAVLHRPQMALAQVQALQVGDIIKVPKAAISDITMEGTDGVIVGTARLGQQNGHRALRLKGAETEAAPMAPQSLAAPLLNGGAAGGADGALEPMAMPASLDDLPDSLGEMPGEMPALDISIPEGGGAMAEGLPEGLPDLPMAPMVDIPTDDVVDIPMAAMPMDIEIA